MYYESIVMLLVCMDSIFDKVIDSSQVTVQRGGSSRSAARSSRRSTQDTAEVEQLREELRQHQERQRVQEEYLRQHAAQQEYYATQFQQQQALIQVSSKRSFILSYVLI